MTETLPRRLRLTSEGRLDDPALLGDPALGRLLGVLDTDGEEARVVGGAVRNSLLGRPIADLDVTTTAEPALVMARAKAASLRTIPTGLAHGTVTVLVSGRPFEVTTLRRDVETDGRHAVVRFTRDFAEDAERRDFTINALSLGRDGTVHDTVGGVADLAAGRVRFIGDAEQRIREDHLRILRFFRFHAAYGVGDPDAEGVAAARRHREAIGTLSRERIGAEMLKLLAAEGAPAAVAAMEEAGIAGIVLGGGCAPGRLARLAAREGGPDAVLRLASLAVMRGEDVPRLRDALRLSGEATRRLAAAEAARARLDPDRPPDRFGCLALLFACGAQTARDGAMLAAAEDGAAEGWDVSLRTLADETVPQLPFGGADVMARGVAGGRRIGAVLKRLQADWIRAGFPRDPVALAALLDAAVAADAEAR